MTDDNDHDHDRDRTERLTEIIEQQNERINQLEDVVQKQAQAIWPTRRQALKATGAAAIFGAGAISNAAAAPGDDGDTVWGSDQNRDDYYADEIDALTVSTGAATVAGEPIAYSWEHAQTYDPAGGSTISIDHAVDKQLVRLVFRNVEYGTGSISATINNDSSAAYNQNTLSGSPLSFSSTTGSSSWTLYQAGSGLSAVWDISLARGRPTIESVRVGPYSISSDHLHSGVLDSAVSVSSVQITSSDTLDAGSAKVEIYERNIR